MPRVISIRARLRLFVGLTSLLALVVVTPSAQVVNRNVNMVTGGTFPGGDPFLQKQNEPSIAVSTRNPCHLLAGANDYRAVNLPGLPEDKEIGDAWLGWYESTDCGSTWYSTLVPGYLQDNSPAGNASPVKGLTAGADPFVRPGGHGTFFYLFIAFNRGSNVGKLALARAIDHNDREDFINPDRVTDVSVRSARSPIGYGGTLELARGSAGQFIDKPSLAVFPTGTGTCTIDGETVPASSVYVAWTEFVGNSPENLRSKIYFARSSNCGQTLDGPATKLSEGYPLGQGTMVAVNPNNVNDIFVVWRQVRNDRARDAILFARSIDGGKTFTKAEYVPGLGEGQYVPFDQNSTSTALGNTTTTFRTLGYSTITYADDGFLYLAVTQPLVANPTGGLGGINSRIMITRTDGTSWGSLVQAVPSAGDGHQFMPALTYAGGRLQLIWYDLRFDETGVTNRMLIDEAEALRETRRRHTLDVLGAQASLPAAWPPPAQFFKQYGVAQPDYNDIGPNGLPPLRGPRISQYPIGDPNPATDEGLGPRQLQFNLGNLNLYSGGRLPFIGDVIDIAGTNFVRDPVSGRYVPNGRNSVGGVPPPGTFHAAWTDNRDARIQQTSATGVLGYAPPTPLPAGTTIKTAPACAVDQTRTRDANVYTARITQDFSLTAPGNAKRTNTSGVIRAFAVQLANGTGTMSTFSLSLTDENASFSRLTFGGPNCALLTPRVASITVNVLPHSSVSRTVYVKCTADAARRIIVTALRTAGPADSARADVIINDDPTTPPTQDVTGNTLGPEAHNPDAENPDAENPDAENPDAENPDAENPDAENPDAENPDAENPDAENPDAENPDAENPDAENPDAENANFQDVSVDVSNDGNTNSGYQVAVQTTASTGGYSFLLLGNRVTSSPTSINCYLVRRRYNQQIFAIPLEGNDLAIGDFFAENDPNVKNATALVRPGESVRVTLRIVWDSAVTPQPFCSTDETDPNYCFKKLVFRTRAQAPNTGETEPREDSVGTLPGPDLTASGPLTLSSSTAGLGGFVDAASVTLSNVGNQGTSDFSWSSFMSSDEIGTLPRGLIGGTGGLEPSETIPSGPFRVYIPVTYGDPDSPVPFPPGTYTVGLLVDNGEQVDETNEANNTSQSASPIAVQPHRVTFTIPTFIGGVANSVTVNLTDGEGSIQNATVTLSLEGPNTVFGVPGPPGSMTPANPTALTNADGNATYSVAIASGSNYRFIATVAIPGVGTMKFQSGTFNVLVPGPSN